MVLLAELAGRRNSQPGVENEDSTELNVAGKTATNLSLRKHSYFHFLRGFAVHGWYFDFWPSRPTAKVLHVNLKLPYIKL